MRKFLTAMVALAALGAALGAALPAWAQAPAPEARLLAPRLEGGDMVMGLAGAPVTLIEYASLTCPHCATFHASALPQLKARYIDTGLVKHIYRDFPLDRVALAAAMLARCAGPERYFTFIDVYYQQQSNWTRGGTLDQVMANLKGLTRLGGMPEPQIDACLANREVETAVLTQQLQGEREFQVRSTPTLIINGRPHIGPATFEALDQVLRPLAGRS